MVYTGDGWTGRLGTYMIGDLHVMRAGWIVLAGNF